MVEYNGGESMDFYSEEYFLREGRNILLREQREFSDSVKHAPMTAKFDVFLSYNISNIDVVKSIYYFLTKKGLKVYLDCIVDPDMERSETDKQTAERIHKRLMNSNSLLYAQSQEAGKSNWMPWELGVVDGNTHRCYIMPVTKNAKQVSPQREYLALYPYIKEGIEHEMRIITESANFGEQSRNFVNHIIASRQ